MSVLKHWHKVVPLLALIVYLFGLQKGHPALQVLVGLLLIGSILAAVHNSEIIAHQVGEPFGTIILAIAITIIEVALIVSLMMAGGEKAAFLARDTVFSAVMIILNAIIGSCIVVGTLKHFEQTFQEKSVNTALVSLIAILTLSLILPNFTNQSVGAMANLLVFVAFASLVIYAAFLFVQTVRHRNYFLPEEQVADTQPHHKAALDWQMIFSVGNLLLSLVVVVLLAKSLSPKIEALVIGAGLPQALVGVVIATVVLLPESIAAIRAANRNDIQTSLNLSFGSALAAIGLTIPAVVVVGNMVDVNVVLGLDITSIILLGLSIATVMLSLSKGKTNIVYGVILLVNFVAFLFVTINA